MSGLRTFTDGSAFTSVNNDLDVKKLTRTNRPNDLAILFLYPRLAQRAQFNINFSGGNTGGVTPVPISNTAVKPSKADGTAWETAWESRTPPGSKLSPVKAPTGLIFSEPRFCSRNLLRLENPYHLWTDSLITPHRIGFTDTASSFFTTCAHIWHGFRHLVTIPTAQSGFTHSSQTYCL